MVKSHCFEQNLSHVTFKSAKPRLVENLSHVDKTNLKWIQSGTPLGSTLSPKRMFRGGANPHPLPATWRTTLTPLSPVCPSEPQICAGTGPRARLLRGRSYCAPSLVPHLF